MKSHYLYQQFLSEMAADLWVLLVIRHVLERIQKTTPATKVQQVPPVLGCVVQTKIQLLFREHVLTRVTALARHGATIKHLLEMIIFIVDGV